jgi:HK97 gp10 family phage protein
MARAKKAVTYMKGSSSFVLEGADELIEMLQKLGDIAAGAAVMAAVIEGGKALEDEIESRAPGPHVITVPDMRSIKRGYAGVSVGPDKEHWYYRFFETGTTPHEIEVETAEALTLVGGNLRERVMNHPGMAAQPFMRPGFDASEARVKAKIGEELWEQLRKSR